MIFHPFNKESRQKSETFSRKKNTRERKNRFLCVKGFRMSAVLISRELVIITRSDDSDECTFIHSHNNYFLGCLRSVLLDQLPKIIVFFISWLNFPNWALVQLLCLGRCKINWSGFTRVWSFFQLRGSFTESIWGHQFVRNSELGRENVFRVPPMTHAQKWMNLFDF